MPKAPRRQIRREPTQFPRRAAALGIGERQLDMALEDVEELISVNAEYFPVVEGTSLRVAKTRPAYGVPGLRLFFTIDSDDQCTLWAVDALPG